MSSTGDRAAPDIEHLIARDPSILNLGNKPNQRTQISALLRDDNVKSTIGQLHQIRIPHYAEATLVHLRALVNSYLAFIADPACDYHHMVGNEFAADGLLERMQLYMYYRFLASSSSETTRTAQWCHQVASMVHAIMKSVIPGASPEQQRQWRDELRQVAQRCIETAGFTRERKQKAVFGVEEVRHMVDVAISQNAYFLNILQHIAIWVLVLLLGLRPGSIVRTKNEEDHYLRWGNFRIFRLDNGMFALRAFIPNWKGHNVSGTEDGKWFSIGPSRDIDGAILDLPLIILALLIRLGALKRHKSVESLLAGTEYEIVIDDHWLEKPVFLAAGPKGKVIPEDKNPMDDAAVRVMFRKIANAAGFEGRGFSNTTYCLRRGAATTMSLHLTQPQAQYVMGHREWSDTLNKYYNVAPRMTDMTAVSAGRKGMLLPLSRADAPFVFRESTSQHKFSAVEVARHYPEIGILAMCRERLTSALQSGDTFDFVEALRTVPAEALPDVRLHSTTGPLLPAQGTQNIYDLREWTEQVHHRVINRYKRLLQQARQKLQAAADKRSTPLTMQDVHDRRSESNLAGAGTKQLVRDYVAPKPDLSTTLHQSTLNFIQLAEKEDCDGYREIPPPERTPLRDPSYVAELIRWRAGVLSMYTMFETVSSTKYTCAYCVRENRQNAPKNLRASAYADHILGVHGNYWSDNPPSEITPQLLAYINDYIPKYLQEKRNKRKPRSKAEDDEEEEALRPKHSIALPPPPCDDLGEEQSEAIPPVEYPHVSSDEVNQTWATVESITARPEVHVALQTIISPSSDSITELRSPEIASQGPHSTTLPIAGGSHVPHSMDLDEPSPLAPRADHFAAAQPVAPQEDPLVNMAVFAWVASSRASSVLRYSMDWES